MDTIVTDHLTKKFETRFGEMDEKNETFVTWLDGLLNFLLYTSDHKDLEDINKMEQGEVIGQALIELLTPYSDNKCIDTIIKIINAYI